MREVRKSRHSLGLSQEQVADNAKINLTYYSKIERGENSVSIDKLEAIAETMDLQISDLFVKAENYNKTEMRTDEFSRVSYEV